MTDRMNAAALRELAGAVKQIAHRRADRMSAYEVANLETAYEQLERYANSIKRLVPTVDESERCDCGALLATCVAAFGRHGDELTAGPGVAEIERVLRSTHTPSPQPPKREQIAEAIDEWWPNDWPYKDDLKQRIFALIQNGADQ